MGHSDEWTFADYFKQEQAVFRGMISAAVALRWMMNTILNCLTTPV